jgi:hypothetical protein
MSMAREHKRSKCRPSASSKAYWNNWLLFPGKTAEIAPLPRAKRREGSGSYAVGAAVAWSKTHRPGSVHNLGILSKLLSG